MPIVSSLGNQRLQDRHWEQIRQTINTEFELNHSRQFTLGQLIQLNVAKYSETILNISTSATWEYKLDLEVEELTVKWRAMAIKTAPYAHFDGYFVFTDF